MREEVPSLLLLSSSCLLQPLCATSPGVRAAASRGRRGRFPGAGASRLCRNDSNCPVHAGTAGGGCGERSVENGEKKGNGDELAGNMIAGWNQDTAHNIPLSSVQITLSLQESLLNQVSLCKGCEDWSASVAFLAWENRKKIFFKFFFSFIMHLL